MPVVKWRDVVVSALVTGFSAIIITPLAMFTGYAFALLLNPTYGTSGASLLAFAIAFVVCWLAWRLMRKRNPDAAMGVILGGAFVVLLSGGCGAVFTSFALHGH